MHKPTHFLLFLFSLTLTSLAAQEDSMKTTMMMEAIHPDRPLQSQSSYLVPKGYFQMEHGFSIEDTDPGFIYSYPSSLWKYGVNENFEIRLMTQYITIQHEPDPDLNGFLPLSLGFKSRLTEQHGVLPKIAFIGQLAFPGIVSKELETTYFAPSLRLAFSNKISNLVSVNYSGGAQWDGETGEPNFLYSLAPSIHLTDRVGIYGELYGSTPQRQDGDIELRVDAGIAYRIGQDLMIDLSAGDGLTDNAPQRYIALGFSYRFKL